MTPNNLTPGLVLKSRNQPKVTRIIEDFRPAEGRAYRQWLVNGQWLNYAEVEARYQLFNPKPIASNRTK